MTAKQIFITNDTAETISLGNATITPGETRSFTGTNKIDKLAGDQVLFDMITNNEVTISDGDTIYTGAKAWDYITGTFTETSISQKSYTGNKVWTHASPRPEKENKTIYVYWSGAGDDPNDQNDVGGGTQLMLINDYGLLNKTVDFHFTHGLSGDKKVYLYAAYFAWQGAGFGDSFTAYMMASACNLQTSVNLDFIQDNGRVQYSPGGPGTGTHGFADTKVCPVRVFDGTGHWNLDDYQNLTPAFGQDGNADIHYDADRPYAYFLKSIPVMGNSSGFQEFEGYDSISISPGYYIRLETNNVSDTDWKLSGYMTLFREKTL